MPQPQVGLDLVVADHRGRFLPPLCAFVASIGISNVVSAFVESSLRTSGIASCPEPCCLRTV